MAKSEPTFLCFWIDCDGEPIECAMFVRADGVPLALAVNEMRTNRRCGPMVYERQEALKGLDRASRFVNRLLEDGVPWETLVSCSRHARRASTPIMALVLAAANELAVATKQSSDPPLRDIAAGGRDFDREC